LDIKIPVPGAFVLAFGTGMTVERLLRLRAGKYRVIFSCEGGDATVLLNINIAIRELNLAHLAVTAI